MSQRNVPFDLSLIPHLSSLHVDPHVLHNTDGKTSVGAPQVAPDRDARTTIAVGGGGGSSTAAASTAAASVGAASVGSASTGAASTAAASVGGGNATVDGALTTLPGAGNPVGAADDAPTEVGPSAASTAALSATLASSARAAS